MAINYREIYNSEVSCTILNGAVNGEHAFYPIVLRSVDDSNFIGLIATGGEVIFKTFDAIDGNSVELGVVAPAEPYEVKLKVIDENVTMTVDGTEYNYVTTLLRHGAGGFKAGKCDIPGVSLFNAWAGTILAGDQPP